jgi:nucleotide-binding universal stress UspA family protein
METILCPTDFSPCSENAVWYADEIAQRMNSRMVLFHNIYEPTGAEYISKTGEIYPYPVRDPDYEQAQQDKLEDLKNKLEDNEWAMPIAYETKIKYGMVPANILQVAREVHADMIVMGHEGNSGLQGILGSSIVADVIEHVSCPLMLVPESTKFRPLHRLVFATDLRGEPFTDVAFVSKLAGLFEAEILFLHILPDESAATRQQAETELTQMQKRMPYHRVSLYSEFNGHIEEGIGQFCQRHKADMLVMGYHPRSFWQHLFTQDYTRQMADHTYLPLLVIHYRK